ncbi:MAG: asparagine synthase-related protein, partial [Gemmatimonadota bacterium]
QVVMAQQKLRRWLPGIVRRPLGAAARRLPVGFRGRTYAEGIAADPLDAVARTGLYLDGPMRAAISPLLRGGYCGDPGEAYRARAAGAVEETLQRLTRADFASFMCDDVLVKVDRASMLASLEVRAPFLDQRLIEFAFGRVPNALRVTLRERKILPRRLAERVLPPALDLKRKQGFSIPLAAWFRGEWGSYIEAVLRSAPPALFDRRTVDSLLAGQRRGLNNGQRLFALAMLELWRKEYGIVLPDPPRMVIPA